MGKTQPTYLSYLLRLRRVYEAGRPVWRISLEAPGSETYLQFEDLAALHTYLATQIGAKEEKGELTAHKKGKSI